jgi:hypothetical protein
LNEISDEVGSRTNGGRAEPMMSHPELEFFNGLSGKLDIQLDAPAERVGDLLNLRASPDARVVRLELRAEVYNPDTEEFRPLTPAELDGVAFRGRSIRLRSEDDESRPRTGPTSPSGSS